MSRATEKAAAEEEVAEEEEAAAAVVAEAAAQEVPEAGPAGALGSAPSLRPAKFVRDRSQPSR
jgi:hypothetical protein